MSRLTTTIANNTGQSVFGQAIYFPILPPNRTVFAVDFVAKHNNTTCGNRGGGGVDDSDKDGGYHWPALLLFLMIIATVWGNVMVCLAVKFESKLRNRFNYFLVSLALSDMLCALLVMPGSVIKLFLGYLPVDRTFCLVWFSMDVFFTASTVIHLCTISTDRYFALKDPIKYHQNKQARHTALKISIVWILAFCCAGPLFILTMMFERTPDSSYKGCGPVNATFVVSATVISFYLPLLIMLVTYILTVYTLKKQTQIAFTSRRQMKELSDASENELTLISTVDSPTHKESIHRTRSARARSSNHEAQMILSNGRSSSFRGSYEATRQSVPIATFYDLRKDSCQTGIANSDQKLDTNMLSPHHSVHREDSYRSSSSSGVYRSIPAELENADVDKLDSSHSPIRTWSKRFSGSFDSRYSKRRFTRTILSDGPEGGSRQSSFRRTAAESVHKGRKAVHILGILFAAFVIFYLPFFLAYLISGVCVTCRDVITLEMITALEWVEYAGSMVNPIIYRIFNPEFRRAFHKLMRCHYRRNHANGQVTV